MAQPSNALPVEVVLQVAQAASVAFLVVELSFLPLLKMTHDTDTVQISIDGLSQSLTR
jgi:hypothetical protein